MDTTPLSPTPRTQIRRERERQVTDRSQLRRLLDEALVAHLGVVVDGIPHVIPTIAAADWDGPDAAGTLYVHGSVAARTLVEAPDQTVCVTITLLDGLVLARSGFNHSLDYRSAMVYAIPRIVTDAVEIAQALDLLVDHAVPERSQHLRRPTSKELAATRVLALSLSEVSLKVRTGPPEDEPEDVDPAVWCGKVPLVLSAGKPVTGPGVTAAVPDHVRAVQRSDRRS